MPARELVKGTIERVLVASGVAALARRRRRGDTLILAYHNVVPASAVVAGERSLHVSQARFAEQLDRLTRTHDVVPLAAVLAGGSGRRPRVAITFDDAYQGAVTVGVAELARRGLAATIFVAPAFVGGGTFWWDALADPETGALDDAVRDRAIWHLGGRDAEVRAWAPGERHTLASVAAHQCVATEAELAAAVRHPGITLASHSWSHPNLATLSGVQLSDELRRPLTWLRERFSPVISWLSYPYGLANDEVEREAAASGYDGAVRISGGWLSRNAVPRLHAVPRYNVPAGLSQAGFILRTAGVGSWG
jgi:peptidoglycan/xylan/chitin deacetylase (PgdA/CDA1 family)